jgi:hypothetical protein
LYGAITVPGLSVIGESIVAAVEVLSAGTYEADVEAGWSAGDFDASGRFDSADLIAALADGGYEQGPRAAVSAVPEPASFVILVVGMIVIATHRRHIVR